MNQWLRQWLKGVLYELIPGACILCEAKTGRNLDLCRDCEMDLPWLPEQCYRCALPLSSPGSICGSCIISPPPWHYCFTAFEYASPVDHLIGEFKNNGQLLTGKVLASLLAFAFAFYHHADRYPDLLVPVPLHKAKLRERGFNQAAEIADVLARHCSIPVDNYVCRKDRETPQQKKLDASARRQNIRHAYHLENAVTGIHIGIVDDVVTTGATAKELTDLFLDAGAASVMVVALARTPHPAQKPVEAGAVW